MKRSVIATAVLLAFSLPVWAGDNPIGILIEGNDKSEISAFENLNVGTAGKVTGWGNTTAGIYVGGKTADFTGTSSTVDITNKNPKQTMGIAVQEGGTANFLADNTNIRVSSDGSDGWWGFGLFVEDKGSTANFRGGDVSIYVNQASFTSQALTVKSGATINFNNSGDVTVTSKSPYGVTVVDAYGDLTFNNKGNVTLTGSIIPGTRTADANVVGIQGSNTNWTITDQVDQFLIKLSGAGVDNDGTSYSTSTEAIYAHGNAMKIDINSKSFVIQMDIPSNIKDETPEGHTAEEAYGVFLNTNASLSIGKDTRTQISVDGLGTAFGICVVNGSTATIDGDAEVTASGTDADNSVAVMLYAGEVAFNGKNNSLTGNVDGENQASLIFQNGTTKINGDVYTDDGSAIALKDAVIDLAAGHTLEAEGSLKSSNSEIVLNEVSENPIISVGTLSGNLAVAASGTLNDTFASPEEAAAALQKSVSITTDEKEGSQYEFTGKSGSISDSWTANAKGEVTQRTRAYASGRNLRVI